MPEPVERVTRARVVDLLRIAEGIAGYAAREVGNGLGPDEARRAALEAAGDLEAAAASLRRLARPDPVADSAARRDDRGASARRAVALELAGRPRSPDTGARRELAAELAAAGVPTGQVAARVGVHPSTVRKWRRRAAGLLRSATRVNADIIGPKRKRPPAVRQHR